MYDRDDDDYSYAIMMGFSDIDDLILFVDWVNENFDTPEGLRGWFDESMDKYLGTRCTRPHSGRVSYGVSYDCNLCHGSFMTEAGLELHKMTNHGDIGDPFWEIINNAYKNHDEDYDHDDLRGPE